MSENFKNADKLTKEQWSVFLDSKGNDVLPFILEILSKAEIKEQLLKTQQNLLADFLFSGSGLKGDLTTTRIIG